MPNKPDSPSPPFAAHCIVGRARFNEIAQRWEYDTQFPIFIDPVTAEDDRPVLRWKWWNRWFRKKGHRYY